MKYSQYSDEIFDKARERFMPLLVSKELTEIEEEVVHIVEALDGRRTRMPGERAVHFSDWSIEDLLSAQGRLALLRVNLSRLASVAQSKTNYAMRYKIYQNSKHWNPTKTRLEKEFERLNQKFVKADVENTLIEAFWETTQKEVFLQEISDRLTTLYEATNQVLTSIKMKINYLTREQAETKYHDNI
jgi:signal recognition particle GTPase